MSYFVENLTLQPLAMSGSLWEEVLPYWEGMK